MNAYRNAFNQKMRATSVAFNRVHERLGVPTDKVLRVHQNLMKNSDMLMQLTKEFGPRAVHEYMQAIEAYKGNRDRR